MSQKAAAAAVDDKLLDVYQAHCSTSSSVASASVLQTLLNTVSDIGKLGEYSNRS